MMRHAIAAILAAGILAACQTHGSSVIQSTEYTCAAATTALKAAVAVNDKMTPAQRQAVSKAVAVINPVCSQPTVPTLSSDAQAALAGALSQITTATSSAQ